MATKAKGEPIQGVKWLTVAEVAVLLDLAPKTVYLLSNESCPAARRLPSHRLGPKGGKLRFHPDDVALYIEATRTVFRESRLPLKHLQPRVAGSSRRRA